MATAFDVEGNWYKGVTHLHSTNSDGRWSPARLMEWYRTHGYHFAVLTDHLHCTETGHLSSPGFLTIPGIEIDGYDAGIDRTPHVVGLGTGCQGHAPEGTSLQGIIDRFKDKGMLAIIAHPYWSALRDDHLAPLTGYAGIEIYNHTCEGYTGKGDSLTHWDSLLHEGQAVWGLAVDDAHCQLQDVGGGWIVVRAPGLTELAILNAIRQGHFYASQGPAIEDWQIEGLCAYVRCSPVSQIQFNAPNGSGQVIHASNGELITEATYTYARALGYLRVTCVDAHGRRAWTNPILNGA
jgi:hypothetical protein